MEQLTSPSAPTEAPKRTRNTDKPRRKTGTRAQTRRRDKRILKLVTETDASVKDIAKRFRCGEETVRKVCLRNNVKLSEKRKATRERLQKEALEILGPTPSYKDLMRLDRDKYPENLVDEALRAAGITVSHRPYPRSPKTMRIEKRLMAGERMEDISLVESSPIWQVRIIRDRLIERDGIVLPEATGPISY